ncbi:hypothetical protein ACJMK2_008084 [Sinanodonta woodiana]|uniref:Cytochrome P450 n=1 Tax=Sinanodonta woodiana TaxID=1069815 RepID=A0ABD3VNS0_SINWO
MLSGYLTAVLSTALIGYLSYILFKVIKFCIWYHDITAVFNNVPGPKEKHWLYGNLHLFPETGEERLEFLLHLSRTYPKYYGMWFGRFRADVTVTHPDTVRKILKTSEPKPTGFGGGYRFALPWLGRGLLIADGTRWARSRRLLTPAFHFDILKPYIHVYNNATDLLLENLEKYARTGTCFETFQLVSLCTLDIILRCAFTYHTDCQKGKDAHPYIRAVNEIADDWNKRIRSPHLYPDFIFYLTEIGRRFRKNCKYVHSVADDIINKRRAILEKKGVSGGKYLDFLDILLTARDEDMVGLTQEEIRNEVDTFLFEGHDTTASAISWILYSLAKHQDIQEKVKEELDSVLQGREMVEWDDLRKMEYLTMVIKEGMRFHSPVPSISRKLTKDLELEGQRFPAGTTVSVNIFSVHHNEEVWVKPMEFIPERFSNENSALMDSFQFVPFSAGPRNCIGQNFAMNEEKVMIARIIHRYKVEIEPNHVPRKKMAVVMRAENGILLRVTERRTIAGN